MQTTRRTILKLAGGAAAGFVLSPIPWKLLDDAAIWTQNWSLIPKLPRGPVTFSSTACTLCTAGCPVRARKVGGNTVSLGRVPAPSLDAPLCLFGLTGHHLAYSPSRLKHPAMRRNGDERFRPATLSEVSRELGEILKHAHEGSVVFLTGRPSAAYVEQLRSLNTMNVRTPSHFDGSFFDMQSSIFPSGSTRSGFDASRVKTVLSVGASLAEGWGVSAAFIPQFRDRRNDIHLIHAGPVQSPTAVIANTWLPLVPGSEMPLVKSLCHELVRGGSGSRSTTRDFTRSLSRYRPDTVAEQTGIAASDIVATARLLSTRGPSIVVADDAADTQLQKAVWELNALLDAFTSDGCMVNRRMIPTVQKEPPFAPVEELEDHSIRLLFIDASVTSAMLPPSIQRKLIAKDNGVVVRFSPYMDSLSERSDFVISTPAPYESLTEIRHRSSAPQASFGLSIPLWETPSTSVSITDAMLNIAAAGGVSTTDLKGDVALLRDRSDRIFRLGRGNVLDLEAGTWTRARDIASEDALWELFSKGSIWVDERSKQVAPPAIVLRPDQANDRESGPQVARIGHEISLPVSTPDSGVSTAIGVVSPLLSKVHQESAHGTSKRSVSVHPETAACLGLKPSQESVCEFNGVERAVVIRTSRTVPPGIIIMTEGVEGLPDNAVSIERGAS